MTNDAVSTWLTDVTYFKQAFTLLFFMLDQNHSCFAISDLFYS